MTALTQDRPTPERDGRRVSDPLAAAAVIYAGALYVLDSAGAAAAATAAATTTAQNRGRGSVLGNAPAHVMSR